MESFKKLVDVMGWENELGGSNVFPVDDSVDSGVELDAIKEDDVKADPSA